MSLRATWATQRDPVLKGGSNLVNQITYASTSFPNLPEEDTYSKSLFKDKMRQLKSSLLLQAQPA